MDVAKKKQARATFTVMNDKGLHTRPATELVKCATHYRSEVQLSHQEMTVNAKSLLGILMLAAAKGAKVTVEAIGEDAEEVICSILDLARNRFHISY